MQAEQFQTSSVKKGFASVRIFRSGRLQTGQR
jgi:hypothetical protein